MTTAKRTDTIAVLQNSDCDLRARPEGFLGPRPEAHTGKGESFTMKPRILIVEDEPAIADNIAYALETEGFETVQVSAGTAALSVVAESRVDLIVLDIGLPDVNGLEICKQIRETHSTPIIFLTARKDEVDRVVGLEIGADDYVIKPFSPRELTARIKAVLRRTRAGGGKGNTSDPFQTNESKRQIVYFGKPLDLSRTEYEILKTFIRRPGQVFSRDQLMDLAWDEPETSLDRTVDVHIKNIRAKLKAANPGKDPIVTHRGSGYSLKEDL
jgi:two-component system, OmpR family, catabolic regulation response regulator CreB